MLREPLDRLTADRVRGVVGDLGEDEQQERAGDGSWEARHGRSRHGTEDRPHP